MTSLSCCPSLITSPQPPITETFGREGNGAQAIMSLVMMKQNNSMRNKMRDGKENGKLEASRGTRDVILSQ